MSLVTGPFRRLLAGAGIAAVSLFLGAAAASAGPTCGMLLGLDYPDGPAVAVPGERVRVRLTLGAGAVEEGTAVAVSALRFFLQCNAAASRLLPCADDRAAAVVYGGDDTIVSTCPAVRWSTGHAAASRPNQVVFTPSEPIVIPASTPGFCTLEFDVVVMNPSRDITPDVIEQMAGLGFARDDVACDNGLRTAVGAAGGIRLE